MERSKSQQMITNIILDVFQLNGVLIQEGDKLTKDLGLTSARWKILGALNISKIPLTVSEVAKTMGQTRQAVQRLANELEADGFLYFTNNPKHKRSKLLALKPKGVEYFERLEERQISWSNTLLQGITLQELEETSLVLKNIINNVGE